MVMPINVHVNIVCLQFYHEILSVKGARYLSLGLHRIDFLCMQYVWLNNLKDWQEMFIKLFGVTVVSYASYRMMPH